MIRRFAQVALLATGLAMSGPALLAAQGKELQPAVLVNTFTVESGVAVFTDDTRPWRHASVALQRAMEWGSAVGRVNWANRFDINGVQFEADVYPRLSAKTYGYANIGYSRARIYPGWRSGAEVFTILPREFEASLGYRQLRFSGPPVTLFTGSVGKYSGNYWFSLRPYLRDKGNGLSLSANMLGRRYTIDAENHVGVRIGYGSTPSDRVTETELTRSNTFVFGLNGSRVTRGTTYLIWSTSYGREELDRGTIRNRLEGDVGLKVKF